MTVVLPLARPTKYNVTLGRKPTAYRKFGYVVKCGAFGLADKFECSLCQPR